MLEASIQDFLHGIPVLIYLLLVINTMKPKLMMDPENGFPALMARAVAAATERSKELANG